MKLCIFSFCIVILSQYNLNQLEKKPEIQLKIEPLKIEVPVVIPTPAPKPEVPVIESVLFGNVSPLNYTFPIQILKKEMQKEIINHKYSLLFRYSHNITHNLLSILKHS